MPESTSHPLPLAPLRSRQGFVQLHESAARDLFLWAGLHVQPALRRWMPLEDFVQEVWARAYTRFDGYDAGRDFRAWLFGIALNVLREQLRSLRMRQRVTPGADGAAGEPGSELAASQTSVVSAVARNEAAALLLRAIDQLPEEQRELIRWRWLEELPYAEIGRRLAVSAVAAESRWRRILERLSGLLPAAALAPLTRAP